MNGIYFLGLHLKIFLISSWQFNWHVFDEFLTIFMTRLLTKSLTNFLIIFGLLWAGDTSNLIFVSFWIFFSRNIWFKHEFEKVYPIWMAPVDNSWYYVNLQNVFYIETSWIIADKSQKGILMLTMLKYLSTSLKLSRNIKVLNDITAAPFLVFFCYWQLRKKHLKLGSCDVITVLLILWQLL